MTLTELLGHLTTIANQGHAKDEVVLEVYNPEHFECTEINEIKLKDIENRKIIVIN